MTDPGCGLSGRGVGAAYPLVIGLDFDCAQRSSGQATGSGSDPCFSVFDRGIATGCAADGVETDYASFDRDSVAPMGAAAQRVTFDHVAVVMLLQ